VIVVDDENGDDEGNLIMAASLTSPEDIAFMIKNGSGIVSVGMKEEDLQRLNLPLMSPESEDEDSSAPTFTVTVVSIIYCKKLQIGAWILSSKNNHQDHESLLFYLRMWNVELPLVYQLLIGRKQWLLCHLLSPNQKISENQVMCFLLSTEMVGFLEEQVTLKLQWI